MKIYIAKDWTGSKVFGNPPKLIKCGGMPDVWVGWKFPFNIEGSFIEDEIPKGKYIEREIWWSIVNIIK